MTESVTTAHVLAHPWVPGNSAETDWALNYKIRKRVDKFSGDFSVSKAPSYYFAAIFVPANTAAHCNALLGVEVIHRV